MKNFKSFFSTIIIGSYFEVNSLISRYFLKILAVLIIALTTATSVSAAVNIGSTAVGSLLDSGCSNNLNGSKITTPAGSSLNIVSMSVYVGSTDSSNNISYELAIYTNSGAKPGTLVAKSSTGSLVANAWNTLPVTATLSASTNYWLVFNTNGRTDAVNNMKYNNGTSGTGVYKNASVSFGTWPSTFGASSLTNAVYTIYATANNGSESVPPSVSITAPTSGATVSGLTNISAVASDNASVPTVQFQIDTNNVGNVISSSPYAFSWNTASLSNGNYTITAIARDASGNETTSAPISITISNSDTRSVVGEMAPLMNWPLVAIHSVLMKTGKVLVLGHDSGITHPQVWDPITSNFTATPLVNDELFCAGQINLANGQVFFAGGHKASGGEDGIKSTYLYDPDLNTWTPSGSMLYDRWYPGVTKLGDGRIVITSGQIVTGSFADMPEIYNPSSGITQALTSINTSQLKEQEYPANFHLPNGKILAISPEHGPVQLMSADATSWANLNTTPIIFGSAVQYLPGKILMTGGGPVHQANSVKNAAVLDTNVASPAWRSIAPMNYARYMHNLVMLPTGQVIAMGGASTAYQQNGSGPLPNEIWDPASETWTMVASLSVPRVYHSTALLLPDGRVFTAGGGQNGVLPNQSSAQIYSPPYLFKGTRPSITNIQTTITYSNSTFVVETPNAANIASIALISLGAVTHSNDMNQFFTNLVFTKGNGQLIVNNPLDGNQVPPGHYMLFIVDTSGVPSVSKIVKVGFDNSSLNIATTTLTPGDLGTAYSAPLIANGGTSPYIWSITNGTLPNGLQLNVISGLISGTPTVAGTYNFTVQLQDANNVVATRSLAIVIGTSQTTSTVGLSTVGGLLDSGNSNYLNGSKVTTTNGGNIVSMSVYVGNIDSSLTNRSYQLAIYSNNGTVPGTLLANSSVGTLVANSWNTLTINSTLQPNSTYWFVYNTNGRTDAVNNMYYNNTSGQGIYSTNSVSFASWPTSFPAASSSTGRYSIYATFAP